MYKKPKDKKMNKTNGACDSAAFARHGLMMLVTLKSLELTTDAAMVHITQYDSRDEFRYSARATAAAATAASAVVCAAGTTSCRDEC